MPKVTCTPETELKRFYAKIKKNHKTGCWEWQSSRTLGGYGLFALRYVKCKPIWAYAHRWAYNHFIGLKNKNNFVCHKCDNPRCCNPDHLFEGTARDNAQDQIKKGRGKNRFNLGAFQRNKTHCAKGHAYIKENIYLRGPNKQYRVCKKCHLFQRTKLKQV